MSEVNFLMVGEHLEKRYLGNVEGDNVYVYVGEESKKFYGFRIECKDGKIKMIDFNDIRRMREICNKMMGEPLVPEPLVPDPLMPKFNKSIKLNKSIKFVEEDENH